MTASYCLDDVASRQWRSQEVCCRCYATSRWFSLAQDRDRCSIYTQDAKPIQSYYYAPGGNPQRSLPNAGSAAAVDDFEDWDWLTIACIDGLREDFRREWALHAEVPPIDVFSIGWHAGLRRPQLRADYGGYRGEAKRGLDRAGVTVRPHRLSLCGYCRTVLPTIDPYLFWRARGWPEQKARQVAAIEAKHWKPGQAKAQVDLQLLNNAPELLPWT